MPGFSAYHLLGLPCVLALGPVIADRELNGASSWATISACFGIGTIVGSVVALRIRARHPMYGASAAFIVVSCQAFIIAYGDSTAVIAGLQIVTGVAGAYGFTRWDSSLGRKIPPHAHDDARLRPDRDRAVRRRHRRRRRPAPHRALTA
jgi:hypothetical protein